MIIYMGLDTATVMGLALWFPKKNLALVQEFKGSPITQMTAIENIIACHCRGGLRKDTRIVMEEQYNFLNAKTVRSLLQRYGYIKYHLLGTGYNVAEYNPKTARKRLGVKTKDEAKTKLGAKYHADNQPFTDNHADALAIALCCYIGDGNEFNYDALVIKPLEGTL